MQGVKHDGREICDVQYNGFICTLQPDHGGRIHVAQDDDNAVVHIWVEPDKTTRVLFPREGDEV
jgi:hypothetical protein